MKMIVKITIPSTSIFFFISNLLPILSDGYDHTTIIIILHYDSCEFIILITSALF